MPTGDQIFDPDYWARRLAAARDRGDLDKAVFEVGADRWEAICDAHRAALAELIRPDDSVLDVACGWGRLLELMPPSWRGHYNGVDIAQSFIDLARERHGHDPRLAFFTADLRRPGAVGPDYMKGPEWDWAVVCGTRPMIVNNAGRETWELIESNVRPWVRGFVFLEYDETNPVEVVRR